MQKSKHLEQVMDFPVNLNRFHDLDVVFVAYYQHPHRQLTALPLSTLSPHFGETCTVVTVEKGQLEPFRAS